jgi:hypothetical protein
MQTLKEVKTPYTISPDVESLAHEPLLIRRDDEAWVVVAMPYAEYQHWQAQKASRSPSETGDSEFERNRAAFQRLLPELLKEHRGEWVAIVDEQPVQFGPDFESVIVSARERFGQRSMYAQEILETPRVYYLGSPQLAPGQKISPVIWEDKPLSSS